MNVLLFTTLFVLTVTVNCDEKIDSKENNKNEKRGAVGGIIYATKQPYADATADASPSKIYAKPSPNVAFSTNTVYTQPQTVSYAKVSGGYTQNTGAHVYATQAPSQVYTQPAPQQYYTQPAPQQHYAQPQFVQVSPAYTLAAQQQEHPQIAYKIGYAQPIHQQSVQYVQQPLSQPILYQAASAGPVPVAQPTAVKIGYSQPIFQKQLQPAYATYASVPTNQHAKYSAAPAGLTKVGYATPAAIAYAAPAPQHQTLSHVTPIHYSPASAVSQFSYVSPHVSYGSNGILTQTSYNSKSGAPQQLSYSASQPIYTAIPAPQQHLAYTVSAPVALTKVGYASPAINYATRH